MKIVISHRNITGIFIHIACISLSFVALTSLHAQKNDKSVPPLVAKGGKLVYTPDSLGNRIPDFSWCGYKAGEQVIPSPSVQVTVPWREGDATLRIQSAIDYVSKLPADKDGLRGAVLLQKGIYKIEGCLRLHTSGVVLRGSGSGAEGTVLSGEGKSRATLITIAGKNDRVNHGAVTITDEYVPVNAREVHAAAGHNFKPGDRIIITRPSTKEWISLLKADHFGGGITALGWKPGQRDIQWSRIITSVNGNTVQFDAPITTSLDKKFGGGTIASYNWPGLIAGCGIENIQLISSYDINNPKDEDHRWMAIVIDNATDSWVRQVSIKHFAGSAVAIHSHASRITVEDCISQQPVSEIGGERRNTFFTEGQQTLFQRCYAEYGIHDFATGFCAPGPNAFVQCESVSPYSFSGGIDSWSSGVLFDIVNVDGRAISFMNRGQDEQGAGWNIANSLLWNCTAARIDCFQPPGAQNWAFGAWSQFSGDGYWGESNNSIEPRSLYYAQLSERLGGLNGRGKQIMEIETDATSSPTVEQASQLTKIAALPATTVLQFIQNAAKRQTISTGAGNAKTIDAIGVGVVPVVKNVASLQSQNGKLVRADVLQTGKRINVPWWSGSARPYALKNARPALTRFVPGQVGKGLTDDLDELTDSMVGDHIIGVEQNYGLWYDRRRDDHERIRRMDGDVWAPFYELPFARSGKETAWDGLSKYDLTKYNYWYWSRLKRFADLADQKGLLLVYQNYFQHNIIEAGAHYTDFPWRPANNINNTGFPEPVPYAGDKRIFMAEQFYDTTHPVRRELHKKYIRQCLDNFRNNNGVIQLIGEEFTGPLHFVQFWLNTIHEWESETGKKELIGLSTTKDVQDAILNDPVYAPVVDIIDIRYWHYEADGKLYAPMGGQNLAPRQHARLLKPKSSSPQQVYNAVREYRTKFPNKAVTYSSDGADRNGWAVLMAGGSLPDIKASDDEFLRAAALMQPIGAGNEKQWVLAGDKGMIVYNMTEKEIQADLTRFTGSFEVIWINTMNGTVQKDKQTIKAGKVNITKPSDGNWALWLKKK